MQRIRIMVAVEPTPLLRVIEHLFGEVPEFQIVSPLHGTPDLAEQAKQLQPDLIITNASLLGEHARETLAQVRRSSPYSKLILMDFNSSLAHLASQSGVDVYLDEEVLVQQLLPSVRQITTERKADANCKS